MSNTIHTTPLPLMAFLTWSLGIDMPGLSLVYAPDKEAALERLQNYCNGAQPKHSLYPTYMPMKARKASSDNDLGVHLLLVGRAPETIIGASIFVIDRGIDVRFDD